MVGGLCFCGLRKKGTPGVTNMPELPSVKCGSEYAFAPDTKLGAESSKYGGSAIESENAGSAIESAKAGPNGEFCTDFVGSLRGNLAASFSPLLEGACAKETKEEGCRSGGEREAPGGAPRLRGVRTSMTSLSMILPFSVRMRTGDNEMSELREGGRERRGVITSRTSRSILEAGRVAKGDSVFLGCLGVATSKTSRSILDAEDSCRGETDLPLDLSASECTIEPC